MSVKYELCEINTGHYMKVLQCFSDDNLEKIDRKNTLFVIIPGNPGIIEFYEHFAIELNKKTNCPVIGVSHTGHLYHNYIKDWNAINVLDQVKDKVKFIEKHLFDYKDPNHELDNIIFVGHSIGCYLILEILELLNKDMHKLVKKSFMLFPAIERMSLTPNGRIFTVISNFFLWFVYFLAFMISCLPIGLQKNLVNFVFKLQHPNAEECMIDNMNDILHGITRTYACIRSCLHMAADEMIVVKELNKKVIKNNLNRLHFYYGIDDKWSPVDFYHDLKIYLNELIDSNKEDMKLILDQDGLDHAFVIFKDQCKTISNFIYKIVKDVI